uniref:SFRICE_015248 n=1 Tax=Spodoptera frugiperda TaxID=7108 RepID=A0A2H1V183_SPOFR
MLCNVDVDAFGFHQSYSLIHTVWPWWKLTHLVRSITSLVESTLKRDIVCSALLLVGLFKPANQSAERALVSLTLNLKQTYTKGTVINSGKLGALYKRGTKKVDGKY